MCARPHTRQTWTVKKILLALLALIPIGVGVYWLSLAHFAAGRAEHRQAERSRVSSFRKDGLEVSLSICQVSDRGGALAFRLMLENLSEQSLSLVFPSAQKYELWIVDGLGKEVWRWSEGKVFAQVVEVVVLGPREKVGFEEEFSPTVLAPGRYVLKARLCAQGFDRELEVGFEHSLGSGGGGAQESAG